MRLAALVQIIILWIFVTLVAAKSGIILAGYYNVGRIDVWVVVVFFVFGSIMNISSPSIKEKLIMGPANLIALISALMVAIT